MIGGKLISQGTFGCVYYPQKNCNGVDIRQQKKKYITKLVVDDKYMDHELYIGKIIQSIPSYETFFSPTTDVNCKLSSVALKRMNINGKCNVIKKHKERNQNAKFRLTKSLFVSNFTLQKRIASLSHHTLVLDTFIQVFSSMLVNIEMIQSKRIVHFDMHDRNIMMRGNRPLLIDFGISFTHDDMIRAATDISKLKKIFYFFAPQMDHIPPEIQYIGFILHERDSLQGHFHNWKYVKDSIQQNQSLIRLIIPSQEKRDMYYQQMEQTFRRMDQNSLEKIIQNFRWETIDTYMLCMIGLNYVYYMTDNTTITDTKRFKNLFSLLKAGIHPDPEKRYSLLELQEKVKPLLIDKNKGIKQKGKHLTVSQKREMERKSEMLSTIRTLR
jgi:hypothetical protein